MGEEPKSRSKVKWGGSILTIIIALISAFWVVSEHVSKERVELVDVSADWVSSDRMRVTAALKNHDPNVDVRVRLEFKTKYEGRVLETVKREVTVLRGVESYKVTATLEGSPIGTTEYEVRITSQAAK